MRIFSFLAIAGCVGLLLNACKQNAPGVETPNGYRMVNHTNKGGAVPKAGDVISFNIATFVGDSMMNDSRKMGNGPIKFPLPEASEMPAGKKVPALYDAVLMTGEGDSITIYQEVDSLIEKQLPASLKKEKYVRYEVVLIDVITAEEQQKLQAEAEEHFKTVESQVAEVIKNYSAGQLGDKLTKLPSGLKMMVVEQGTGAALKVGDPVETNYYGALKNGTMFDNSFQRGEPLPFQLGVGQMIKGFDEGTQQLNHGGKAYFFIPAELGYGAQDKGAIPPNSELIFYVEVL